MSLIIDQTHALIGIDRMPGKLEIETQSARLELHQKHAKINIKTELPKVQIDQYECFASSGLKNTSDLSREISQRAYQQVMQTIAKISSDGDMLAAIERGGNPIAHIAERDSFVEHEFGYDYMPKVGPKITVTGDLKIEAERNWEGVNNGVEGNYIPGDVNFNFTPTKINIYMKQYASINMKYQPESKVDVQI